MTTFAVKLLLLLLFYTLAPIKIEAATSEAVFVPSPDDAVFALEKFEEILKQASKAPEILLERLIEPFKDEYVRSFDLEIIQTIAAGLRLLVYHRFVTAEEFLSIMSFINGSISECSTESSIEFQINIFTIQISKFLLWRRFTRALLEKGYELQRWTIHGIIAFLGFISGDLDPASPCRYTTLYLEDAFATLTTYSSTGKPRSLSIPTPTILRESSVSFSLSASECKPTRGEKFETFIIATNKYIPVDSEVDGFTALSYPETNIENIRHNIDSFSLQTTESEWDDADVVLTTKINPMIASSGHTAENQEDAAKYFRSIQQRCLIKAAECYKKLPCHGKNAVVLCEALIKSASDVRSIYIINQSLIPS